jgi:hypothetical protein
VLTSQIEAAAATFLRDIESLLETHDPREVV